MNVSVEMTLYIVLIIVLILVCNWIVLEGVQKHHRIGLKSINSLRLEIVELRAALEKHDNKPEWWERDRD